MKVDSNSIEFVDSYVRLPVGQLSVSPAGKKLRLHASGESLFLEKQQSSNLADERVSNESIPFAATTTYFGKLEQRRGVRHQAVKRDGLLDGLPQDTGLLHHLVSGERDVAVKTMQSHLFLMKWGLVEWTYSD